MEDTLFRIALYLPAGGASESEATIVEWRVAEGEQFQKDQVLGVIDSVKSVFDFPAPCAGRVVRLLHRPNETIPYTEPVMEIETSDASMRQWIPPAAAPAAAPATLSMPQPAVHAAAPVRTAVMRGIGGYLPQRVVTNAELLTRFPDLSDDYIYQVTGIRQRRWAESHQKPSDMGLAAAVEAIEKSGLPRDAIDAVIVATTTPDVAMPATACILQERLGLRAVPAFDLNAACSGWLYAVSMAQGMIAAGTAQHVLTVGVDMQSRLLDKLDRATCFIFGDGAGAAVISAGDHGHRICRVVLGSDPRGLHMARREAPGYEVPTGQNGCDPWIRLDGQALFRFATESFAGVIRTVIDAAGWMPNETRWVMPHQANARILKAAAKRSGVPFDRFYLNLERLGNTSSASIPLALLEVEKSLNPGDKLVLCSVGAGATMAAVAVEW